MSPRSLVFAIAFAAFLTVLLGAALAVYRRGRRSSRQGWEKMLAQLASVDRYKIALIAASMTEVRGAGRDRGGEQAFVPEPEPDLEPEEIWDLIGGMNGLEALGANCDVLIALACEIQDTYPEALMVAERLRLHAREIQWHLARLRSARRAEGLHRAFPHYAQRTVATYYVMTQSLLELYAVADWPAHAQLLRAL